MAITYDVTNGKQIADFDTLETVQSMDDKLLVHLANGSGENLLPLSALKSAINKTVPWTLLGYVSDFDTDLILPEDATECAVTVRVPISVGQTYLSTIFPVIDSNYKNILSYYGGANYFAAILVLYDKSTRGIRLSSQNNWSLYRNGHTSDQQAASAASDTFRMYVYYR